MDIFPRGPPAVISKPRRKPTQEKDMSWMLTEFCLQKKSVVQFASSSPKLFSLSICIVVEGVSGP